MRSLVFIILAVIIVAGGLAIVRFWPKGSLKEEAADNSSAFNPTRTMKLESPAFGDNQLIPVKYTCDGANINPPLRFSDVPEGARTLVLIMDDPDVPRSIRPDGVWDHWLVWNIPASLTTVSEGEEPPGVVGRNTSGRFGYEGPCPPDREHRYFFKLYALDSEIDLSPQQAAKEDLEKAMAGHILAEAKLVGRYRRQ